ncbi:hypothetical protein P3T76_010264 [Phytophthora citrophthora]|uniref:M96 mating-specific protein family n=1 Tax=Phytophthora citrophthora TaxID=4793 RepID=A0AAD9GC09_9STRA|nr:hypothetical protein P3T76_010264 [Phytophthora citrophthora]
MMPSCMSPGSSYGLLESFLGDMDALDGRQTLVNPNCAVKKRKLDVVGPPSSKKKLPSWLKRKQELESLRQQTQAMETRVAYLEMKKTSVTGGLNAFELFKLQSFAEEEKQKCITTQNENERLKAKLLRYVQRYKSFQEVMNHAELEQQEILRIMSRALRVETGAARQLQVCGAHVFDMMEGKLDARFYELEHAYALMKQPMAFTDSDMIQTRDEERGAVEFTRLELLPFKEKAISSIMWSFVISGKFPDGEDSIVSRRTDDSLAVTTRVSVQLSCGGVVTIDTYGVMKQFMTSEGYAVMTESCSEWHVDSPVSGKWMHRTREGGCFVMRDYAANATPGICQARSFICLYPGENEEKAQYCSRAASSSIRQVVVPSFRQLTLSRHQFVQNALFDTIRS